MQKGARFLLHQYAQYCLEHSVFDKDSIEYNEQELIKTYILRVNIDRRVIKLFESTKKKKTRPKTVKLTRTLKLDKPK